MKSFFNCLFFIFFKRVASFKMAIVPEQKQKSVDLYLLLFVSNFTTVLKDLILTRLSKPVNDT